MKSPWRWGVGLLALAGLTGHARGQDLYALTNNSVLRITPEGAVSTFASFGGLGATAMAFNGTGTLFVSVHDSDGAVAIDEISRGGTVRTFVSGISGNLAFNSAGTLFVADSDHTISAITPGGVVSPFASGFNMVKGLAMVSDTLYAADYGNAMVYAVSSGGGISPAGGAVPLSPGQMGLTPDILVSDSSTRLWSSSEHDDGEFTNIYGLVPAFSDPYIVLSGIDPGVVTGMAYDGNESLYYSDFTGNISVADAFNNENLLPQIFVTGIGAGALAFSTVPEPSAAPVVMGLAVLVAGCWRSKRRKPFDKLRVTASS